MKRIIIITIMTFLLVGSYGVVENYIDLKDQSNDPDINNTILPQEFDGTRNGRYMGDKNISDQDIRADTIINIKSPEVRKKEIEAEGYVLANDIKQSSYDSTLNWYEEPGLVFTFQVLEINNGSEPKPINNAEVVLIINSSFSVFSNYTVNYTDSQGFVNFIFNSTLTDTEWGYTLAMKDPEELVIIAKFLGNEKYKPSETMPIQTTHWPCIIDYHPPPPPSKGYSFYIWLVWMIIMIIVIVTVVLFYIVWDRYEKRNRLR